MPQSVPTRSRRSRPSGKRERLTRATVVSAASTLASRGLGELTMSSLATELGVTPMAVYRHVDNKDHLLSLVLQHALEKVEVPPPSAGTWGERIRRLHGDITDVMVTYPGLQWGLHAVSVDATERLLEAYLTILLDAGFDEATAIQAYTGLYYLAIGVVTHAEHAVRLDARGADAPRAREQPDRREAAPESRRARTVGAASVRPRHLPRRSGSSARSARGAEAIGQEVELGSPRWECIWSVQGARRSSCSTGPSNATRSVPRKRSR